MDQVERITNTLRSCFICTYNDYHFNYDNIVHLIIDFVGDYKLVKDLKMESTNAKHVLERTKLNWMKRIMLKKISKIEEKQGRFFGNISPHGTPSESSYDEESLSEKLLTPTYNSIFVRREQMITPKYQYGNYGSPTATPSSSEDMYSLSK